MKKIAKELGFTTPTWLLDINSLEDANNGPIEFKLGYKFLDRCKFIWNKKNLPQLQDLRLMNLDCG
jgi:hypothetical protein